MDEPVAEPTPQPPTATVVTFPVPTTTPYQWGHSRKLREVHKDLPTIHFLNSPSGIVVEIQHAKFVTDGVPEVNKIGTTLTMRFSVPKILGLSSTLFDLEMPVPSMYDVHKYTALAPADKLGSLFIYIPFKVG